MVTPPPAIKLAHRQIGPGWPCFIIAEAGVNHNGSVEMAHRLVDAAADSGADAVKFQTFRAEDLVTRDAPMADYQAANTGSKESQFELLKRLELSREAHRELVDHAAKRSILFLSTPFDEASAHFLGDLGVPAFKVSSGELTNLPFLETLARTGKPIILSTGMGTLAEVECAVTAIRRAGNNQIVVLHCVSCYPAMPADVNLRAMHTMQAALGLPVGYSDHTLGTETALAAVALGACVIEKHFTLDRELPGPDHKASLTPSELCAMVAAARNVEAALGTGVKAPAASERNTAAVARKSLVASRDIAAGTPITGDMIAVKRPGTGLPPAQKSSLVGRVARREIRAGTLLNTELLE
jgi:N,N'-diacetyllegionaminate synthase